MVKKYKGYYEATIRMELNEEGNLSLEEVKKNMEDLADNIQSILIHEMGLSKTSTLIVTKTKGDVYYSC